MLSCRNSEICYFSLQVCFLCFSRQLTKYTLFPVSVQIGVSESVPLICDWRTSPRCGQTEIQDSPSGLRNGVTGGCPCPALDVAELPWCPNRTAGVRTSAAFPQPHSPTLPGLSPPEQQRGPHTCTSLRICAAHLPAPSLRPAPSDSCLSCTCRCCHCSLWRHQPTYTLLTHYGKCDSENMKALNKCRIIKMNTELNHMSTFLSLFYASWYWGTYTESWNTYI